MNNAMTISATEPQADLFIIRMAVLLHDMCDSKFNGGDDEKGFAVVEDYLASLPLDSKPAADIMFIIRNMSFKHSFGQPVEKSIEFQIVQDADRLDAIGATGIARTFSYGGHKGTPFYDDNPPQSYSDSESYKNTKSSTINHFYEKLLLLKDLMNTIKGRELAEGRHAYMVEFLKQFDSERKGLL